MLPNVRPATGTAEEQDEEGVPPPPPPPPPPRPISAAGSEDDPEPPAPPTPPGEQEEGLEHELGPGSPSYGVLLMPPPETPPSRLCSPESVGLGRLATPDIDPRRAGLTTPDIDPRRAGLATPDIDPRFSGLHGLAEDSEEDEYDDEEFPPGEDVDETGEAATGKERKSKKRKADRSAADDKLQQEMVDAAARGRRGRGRGKKGKSEEDDRKDSKASKKSGSSKRSRPSGESDIPEDLPDYDPEADEDEYGDEFEPDEYDDEFEPEDEVAKPAEGMDLDGEPGPAAAAAGSRPPSAPSVDVDGAPAAAGEEADKSREPSKEGEKDDEAGPKADELQDSMISAAAQARREAARKRKEASMTSDGDAAAAGDAAGTPTAAGGELRDAASSSPAADAPAAETPLHHIEAEKPLVVEDISDKDKESRGGSKDVPDAPAPDADADADADAAGADEAHIDVDEEPVRMPTPPEEIVDPEEAYEKEVERAGSDLQMAALRWLREQDNAFEAKFTARQAVELVRELANAKIRQAEKVQRTEMETKPWKRFTCDCCIWVVFAIILAWTAMLVAASLSRPILSETEGVLTTADGQPAAAALVTNFQSFAETKRASEDTLRRIRDCTFVHGDASHRMRAASLVRSAAGDLTISAPDGSRLRLLGKLGSPGGRVTFTRPFFGEETIELGGPPSQGCSFTVMSAAPVGEKMKVKAM